jgi:hypothetical protein
MDPMTTRKETFMSSRTRNALAVAAAVVCMVAAGCTDTTVEPKSAVTDANVFSDPGAYKAFIAKVYGGLAVTGQQGPAGNADISGIDEGFSQYLRIYWEAQELPTDEAVIGWNDVGLPELNKMTWSATNGFVVAMYYRVFYQISLANQFLRESTDEKLASRNVPDDIKAQVKTYRAEARFLRALSYWHGLDLFGDIPLVTDADQLTATPPKQATKADVYNFIVSELNAIKGDLPVASSSVYGRATKGAASMLLAEVYLNAATYTGTAHYSEALAAASEVIAGGYSLDPNYKHLFQADNNTSPEIVFPIPFDGKHTQTWGGMTFLVHAAVGGNMDPGAYGIDGGWWGLRMKQQAYALYTPGDKRGALTFTNGQNVNVNAWDNFNDGVALGKYSNKTSAGVQGSDATHPDTDFPMFRLADAYLIYAEANLRGGGGTAAQALTYVNALRQRAFGDASANITSAQLTLDFILNERGRELMWEGHRRTDLIRFGKFAGSAYIWAYKGGSPAGAATDAHFNLYPLPANELVANPNLKQNPGY